MAKCVFSAFWDAFWDALRATLEMCNFQGSERARGINNRYRTLFKALGDMDF